MLIERDVPPGPAAFCEALQRWVADSPTQPVAPPLQAAGQVAQRLGTTRDAAAFERQLLRLASFETPGVDAETVAGAQVVLDLWYALGENAAP